MNAYLEASKVRYDQVDHLFRFHHVAALAGVPTQWPHALACALCVTPRTTVLMLGRHARVAANSYGVRAPHPCSSQLGRACCRARAGWRRAAAS